MRPADGKTLPLVLTGRSDLRAIHYHAAARFGAGKIVHPAGRAECRRRDHVVRENRVTRDHSERMLRGFGAKVTSQRDGAANIVKITGGQGLGAQETVVPGDPSSAAFLAAAAMISPRGGIVVEGMMSNETRDGFYRAASLMGAHVGAEDVGDAAGERLIDMSFESAALKGAEIPVDLVPSMIDEFPILAVLAAQATGTTIVTGAAELRVKESDRISAVVNMLRVNGVKVEETADGFSVEGCAGAIPGGGLVETHHDHRIAMSALVMGTVSQNPVSIDDASMIATSYPEFMDHMHASAPTFERVRRDYCDRWHCCFWQRDDRAPSVGLVWSAAHGYGPAVSSNRCGRAQQGRRLRRPRVRWQGSRWRWISMIMTKRTCARQRPALPRQWSPRSQPFARPCWNYSVPSLISRVARFSTAATSAPWSARRLRSNSGSMPKLSGAPNDAGKS